MSALPGQPVTALPGQPGAPASRGAEMPFLEPSALGLSAPVELMPPYIAACVETIRSRGLSMQRQTALYDQGWGIERRVACIKDLQRCARYYAKQDLETYVRNPEIVF